MYPGGSVGTVLILVNLAWLLVLSFLVWKNQVFLKNLFPSQGGDFKSKLSEVLKEVEGLESFKKQSQTCIQKVVLKRYNPYEDTGGDQSFSIALLSGNGDGVVVTSLHSRAGTRVFAKSVKNGGEDKTVFSKEEKEVVVKAYEFI